MGTPRPVLVFVLVGEDVDSIKETSGLQLITHLHCSSHTCPNQTYEDYTSVIASDTALAPMSPVLWWKREVVMWGSGVNSVWCLVVVLLSLLVALWLLRPNRHLPPGPWGIPLMGYLPWLNPRAPHLTLMNLTRQYGKVFSLRLGSVLTVVVADPALVRDMLARKEAAGRAPLFLTHGIMHGYGLICSEGEMWREHRKFVLGFMKERGTKAPSPSPGTKAPSSSPGTKTPSPGTLMEAKVLKAAHHFVQELEESAGVPVEVAGPLLHHVGNLMNQVIFGTTYEETNPTWRWLRRLLQEGTKLVGVAGPLNFLPWLRFLPYYRQKIKFITENQIKTHNLYQEIFDKHEATMTTTTTTTTTTDFETQDEGRGVGGHVMEEPVHHIVDAYIKERHARKDQLGSFTWRQLQHVTADQFGAGSETTITTLQWHLLTMALHPEAQDRAWREMEKTNREGHIVTLAEAPSKLPYTLASIYETQRLYSILPLGIPHGALQDMKIGGYSIPKGTMLLPFLWAVHHDTKDWPQPFLYLPQRFLDGAGSLLKPQAFMPFQTGRRMCIGDEFAKMMLLHFSTTILLHFKVQIAKDDKDDPISDPISGISLTPRPFKLLFLPRTSMQRGRVF